MPFSFSYNIVPSSYPNPLFMDWIDHKEKESKTTEEIISSTNWIIGLYIPTFIKEPRWRMQIVLPLKKQNLDWGIWEEDGKHELLVLGLGRPTSNYEVSQVKSSYSIAGLLVIGRILRHIRTFGGISEHWNTMKRA